VTSAIHRLKPAAADAGSDPAPNDLSAFWMPFTDNRSFKTNPRLLASAKGMYYFTPEGRKILDGTAGLWCVNAGHCHPHIVSAVKKQVETLDFAPTFQLGHPKIFEFATRVAEIMPAGLDRIFFTNSGSESVDTALKIALAYHKARGQSGRTRLIGRERGYHGTGFGGISVGGIVSNRRTFGPLLPGVDHLRHTYDPKVTFVRGQPETGAELAEDLQRIIDLHGAETIAAVIVEPMAGSTGVLIPPKGYLERLRQITATNGILLIFDEVISAFGRLGAGTAAELLGVIPDLITCAKGLTNGTIPMGAVAVSSEIHDTVLSSAARGIELFHGYTYSGHPLGAAAGLATLDVYKDEGLFENAASLSPYWEDAVHALRGAPHVIDIRNMGLVAGIELAPRPGAPGRRAMDVFHRCFDKGVLIRVTADIVALSPPLTVNRGEIDTILSVFRDTLTEVE